MCHGNAAPMRIAMNINMVYRIMVDICMFRIVRACEVRACESMAYLVIYLLTI